MEAPTAFKRPRSDAISEIQKEKLTDFMANNPILISAKFSSTFTRQDSQRKWEEIAEMLNAETAERKGAVKTWDRWRKTWQDLKKATIKKNSVFKTKSAATGGGRPPIDEVDEVEAKILDVVGPTTLNGDEAVKESPVLFSFGEEPDTAPPILELKEDENRIPAPSTSTGTPRATRTRQVTRPRRKIPTRIARLQTSQQLAQNLQDLSYQNLQEQREYRKRKLEILEKQVENQEAILMALNKINDTLGNKEKVFVM